ncbi:SpoIIE family protein phosphatase [Flammeovirga sp. SJP92]|uniref:SpoIIE family protein phosphatase n=1 Tax=Flammeovirga sp. SJP92 TaxID=1775430 RepID=UPI00078864C3|nr:SpoIIE family protein phosphatase [Flammeovirga sp. SJP92]KXX72164.1 hypothetical protein AVL50_00775 [Flammeovirga sp. SJP92]
MKLTPQKRQAKSIKTRLVWSFATNLLIISVVFFVYAYIRNTTTNAENVVIDLATVSNKVQKIKAGQQSFLLSETINPTFYETKKNKYIEKNKQLISEINEQIDKFYVNEYVKRANVIVPLRNLEKSISLYHTTLDSLVAVQLKRGFKSYGVEGDMRRSVYSVMNSGYDLDQVKILSLRRHEKDYILRKDKAYAKKLSTVIEALKVDIDKTVSDKYGRVYLKGALDNYEQYFQKLVNLDAELGYFGHSGIKDNLNVSLNIIEKDIQNISEVVKEYERYWQSINIIILFVSAFSIILVNALLLYYLLNRLGKPINELSKSIHKIVEDKFQGKIYTINTKDEIGALSRDFNYVLEKMNDRSEEILKQKEELATTYEKIDTIRQIGNKISNHTSVSEIIEEFNRALSNVLDFSLFMVGIVHEDEMHYQGYDKEGKYYELKRSLLDNTHLGVTCYNSQEAIICEDFLGGASNPYKHLLPVITHKKAASLIYLPLTTPTGKIGVLAIHNDRPNAYSDVEINMLGSIVVYAVSALQTAINYEDMETQVLKKTQQINRHRDELMSSNLLLQGTLEELEKKNSQQTSSIQYAKRIQQALLPNISLIRSQFEDAFVFYRPKDIVSGDFYWLESKGDYTYLAVADCTGHGVPGAFMSILGREILSNLINSKEHLTPAQLLDELNVRIRVVLQQERMNNKDGMDIGICVINKKKRELTYAGAHHPLYLVKKDAIGNREIEVVAGERQSIGGHVFKKKQYQSFTNHMIRLDDPNAQLDAVYMCTDGYQDQFGGEKGQKFYKKNMRKLFLDVAQKPMFEQKSIIAMTINEWMQASEKQTDDILVIGFKLPPVHFVGKTLEDKSVEDMLGLM